ncbi:Lipase [Macleaya cordata]|uniref:Lipase n=1 Tax=Macleaya cordata TaxID=56857 RepID=A0A200QFB1_MACCD|nr:Lipase [Macleaya cordata]
MAKIQLLYLLEFLTTDPERRRKICDYMQAFKRSDGRLAVDFIAQSIGLQLLPPYLPARNSSGYDFRQGVNFAVVGATALDASFFEERLQITLETNYTLGVQLGWFKNLLPSLCNNFYLYCNSCTDGCLEYLNKTLFLVGEIGGNDYTEAFFRGRSLAEVRTFVPKVIDAIASAINILIEEGAVTLVVPGKLPTGCSPAYLTYFKSCSNKDDYSKSTGCLKWPNKLAKYHNKLLQKELDRLQVLHPHPTIIYADYYNAAMRFYMSPDQLGTPG